jgi:hypothetical protein
MEPATAGAGAGADAAPPAMPAVSPTAPAMNARRFTSLSFYETTDEHRWIRIDTNRKQFITDFLF